MAPTICLAELPMAGGTASPYICQRQRIQRSANVKRQILGLREMLRTGRETSLENCLRKLEYANKNANTTATVNCPLLDRTKKLPTNTDDHCKQLVVARKDLLSIAVRTVILVRHNRILQRRVNALRAETWRFLRSILNNPKNNCQQRKTQVPQSENETASLPVEKTVSRSLVLHGPVSIDNSFHKVTSTCGNHNSTDEKSDKSNNSDASEW